MYWDAPYHLLPNGKTGIEAFAVIRDAMQKEGMVALGRLVMTTRERICAIEVAKDAFLLTTLRTAEEVRAIDDVGPVELPKTDPRMLDIARKIIEQQAGDFDPSQFTTATRMLCVRSSRRIVRAARAAGPPQSLPQGQQAARN